VRPAVRNAFVAFNAPMEGVTSWMYLDVKGLVTCAIGNLIDPVEYAIGLPWLMADGTRATEAEIRGEWERIKARQDWRLRGGAIFKSIALLHLDEAGILVTVSRKLDEMDRALSRRFSGYEEWPADAQLATLSMSWACGAAFRFPRLEEALRGKAFAMAAEECTISTVGNPGVKPRNERNRVLYRNASVVASRKLNPEALYWPRDLMYGPVDTEAPTLPALNEDDDDGTPTKTVPEMRPPPFEKVTIIHPKVPLGRPALDDDDDPEAA
jgi:hypothetical protein